MPHVYYGQDEITSRCTIVVDGRMDEQMDGGIKDRFDEDEFSLGFVFSLYPAFQGLGFGFRRHEGVSRGSRVLVLKQPCSNREEEEVAVVVRCTGIVCIRPLSFSLCLHPTSPLAPECVSGKHVMPPPFCTNYSNMNQGLAVDSSSEIRGVFFEAVHNPCSFVSSRYKSKLGIDVVLYQKKYSRMQSATVISPTRLHV